MKHLGIFAVACSLLFGLPACETMDDNDYRVVVSNDGDHDRYHRTASSRPHHPGPPPHAPAHGYRHKHQQHDVELVYDRNYDCYAVVGYEDHYYRDGYYFRYRNGDWEVSVGIGDSGSWSVAGEYSVPRKLKHKHSNSGGKGHPGRGKGKGKRSELAPNGSSGDEVQHARLGKY